MVFSIIEIKMTREWMHRPRIWILGHIYGPIKFLSVSITFHTVNFLSVEIFGHLMQFTTFGNVPLQAVKIYSIFCSIIFCISSIHVSMQQKVISTYRLKRIFFLFVWPIYSQALCINSLLHIYFLSKCLNTCWIHKAWFNINQDCSE